MNEKPENLKDTNQNRFLTPSFIPASRETSRVMTGAPSPEPHLGWFSRGYLPHWDHPGMIQSVNFRLHDSVPREVLEKWKQELGLPLGAPASLPARTNHKLAGTDAGAPRDLRNIEPRKRMPALPGNTPVVPALFSW